MVHSRAYVGPNVVVFCLWDPERGTSGSATAFSSFGVSDIIISIADGNRDLLSTFSGTSISLAGVIPVEGKK